MPAATSSRRRGSITGGGMRSIGMAIAAAAFVAGCAGDPNTGTGPRENTGTLVGALAGAAIGSQIRRRDRRANRSRRCGRRHRRPDRQPDRRRRWTTRTSGAPMTRRSRRSNAARPVRRSPGKIRIPAAAAPSFPVRNMIVAGRNAADFTHTIYIDGRPQVARGDACRNPDGTWRWWLRPLSATATPCHLTGS